MKGLEILMLKDAPIVYHHSGDLYEWRKTQFVIGSELPRDEHLAHSEAWETKPPYFVNNELHVAESRPAYIENGILHLGPVLPAPPEAMVGLCRATALSEEFLEEIKEYARSKGLFIPKVGDRNWTTTDFTIYSSRPE